jgi:hypothetical protein
MQLTPAAAPLALTPPPAAALGTLPAGGLAAAPPPALWDAAFAVLVGKPLPGTPVLGFPGGGALAPHRDGLTPAADRWGAQQPRGSFNLLSAGSGRPGRSEDSGLGLLDSAWTDEGGLASAASASADALFAGLADGTATQP